MHHALKCGLAGGAAGLLLATLERAMGWELGIAPYCALGVFVGLIMPNNDDD